MNLSQRHHYLPRFYLKRFTNPDGMFHIWLSKEKRFKDGGKLFSPKSHFFEKEGNTVTYEGVQSDFVETQLANIDDRVAKFYQKLDTIHNDYKLENEEWQRLQYFINSMFWRLPCNEPFIANYIKRATTLGHFGIKLMNTETQEIVEKAEQDAFLKRIKDDPQFLKFLRVNMPAFTYHHRLNRDAHERDLVHIINFPYTLPRLISDNPIIFRNPTSISPHLDDMVFPLTSHKILFRNQLSKMTTHSFVRVMIDLLLLMQAKEFVATTDLAYPELLLRLYDSEYRDIDMLRNEIFCNVGANGEELPAYKRFGVQSR